jgi:hypothetical protein
LGENAGVFLASADLGEMIIFILFQYNGQSSFVDSTDRVSGCAVGAYPMLKGDGVMSIAEIIPAVQALSRGEKLELAHLLLEDLAKEDPPPIFKEGQVYPIYTPEFALGAATQLARILKEEGARP